MVDNRSTYRTSLSFHPPNQTSYTRDSSTFLSQPLVRTHPKAKSPPRQPQPCFLRRPGPEKAAYWVSKLKPHSYACFHSVVTVGPWLKIPSSYLVCENDYTIPVHGQDGMVAYAQEKSGGKAFDHVERCSSGHSPFLSMLGTVVEYLERAMGRV
jgi:hypothetical protein